MMRLILNNKKYIIYKITNLINNKIYIGQTSKTLKQRFNKHVYDSKTLMHRAIKKYGKENFIISEIDTANTLKSACHKEKYWIKKLKSKIKDGGYNITDGGEGTHGVKPTQEKILKHKNMMREKWKDPVFKERGVKYLLSYVKKGPEHHMYGKHHTEKALKKMRGKCGEKSHRAKLTEQKVIEMRSLYASGHFSTRKLAKMFNIGKSAVFNIVKRITWAHV